MIIYRKTNLHCVLISEHNLINRNVGETGVSFSSEHTLNMVGLLLQHLVETLQDVWGGVTMTSPCLSNYLRAWDPNCILELVRPLMTFPGEACGHWVSVPGHSGFELCQQSNCGAVCQSVLHHPSIHRHVVRRFYLDSFF